MATVSNNVEREGNRAPVAGRLSVPIAGGRAALAALAVFVALLLNLLLFHGYPVFKPEVGLALLALAAVALLYGVLYAVSNRWLRGFLEALLVAAALDAGAAPTVLRIVGGIAVLAFVLWKKRSVLPFVTIVALVASAASALGLGQQHEPAWRDAVKQSKSAPGAARLPAIVHIILDEHIGLDGLPPDNPQTPSVRAALERFYFDRGFRVFGRAHSDFAYTTNSIPEILNFGAIQKRETRDRRTLRHNAYFELLGSRGYRLHVYQSERLNYCASEAVVSCLTYQTQSIAGVASLPLSTETKAGILLRKLVSKAAAQVADFAYNGVRTLGVPLPYREITEIRLNPVNSAEAFDRFNSDLRRARPGEVYFAHFLLPHSPYALTPDCRVRDEQWNRREYKGPLSDRQNSDFAQMQCALRKVQSAYDAISASPASGNFVMILHGDHGSRITDAEPFSDRADAITDAQKIADFSTLFAARAPKLGPGYDDARLSAGAILENLARSDFSIGDEPRRPGPRSLVVLTDKRHIPRVRIPLPARW